MISAAAIARRVEALGAQIDRDLDGEEAQLVVVMDGAWVFAADLARAMRTSVVVSFLEASSYGNRTESSGVVRVRGASGLRRVRDRLIVVDDIVDTGRTARAILDTLDPGGAAPAKLASLLSKPGAREIDVSIDYLGFEIPSEFVVGYGMDYRERYRSLPDIHVLS